MAQDLEQLVLTISADTRQMQRALKRLTGDTKAAADSVDAAFSRATPKIDNVAKSLGKTRFETANLAAQFQDIAVQLQGGASPFTVALQQGTQISQVIGQRGAAGAVGLLTAAFGSLLNPVSLATIAVIALGGAAVKYVSEAIGGVDDLDGKLKTHAELIKGLKDAYGEAGKGVDTSVKESIAVLQTLLGLSTDALQKQFQNLSLSINNSLTSVTAVTDSIGGSIVIEETSGKFDKFKAAIDEFRASVNAGKPDVIAFRAALSDLIKSDASEDIKKQARALYEMTDGAAKAQLAIEGTSKSLRGFSAEALAAAEQGEAFAKAMKALGDTVSPKLDDRQKILENYNKALLSAGSTEERLAAARVKDAQLAILADNDRKKAAEDAAKSAESAQKRFDSALVSSAKNAATVAAGAEALGLGAGAMARLQTEARLTEAAMQSFGKVTDEVKARITAQANAAGEAADKLARARVAASTEFGLKTAFLTPEDAQIASQLASIYGNDIPRALSSTEAAGIRAVNALRDISHVGQEINRGFLLDFTQQIRNGASAMDALQTAGLNALGKIADKLVSMAADNLWNAAFGGGGSGGLGGLFGSLFGGSSGAGSIRVGNQTFPSFASGTNSAPGGLSLVGENGPELLNLPRGAQVIPNDILRKMVSMPEMPTAANSNESMNFHFAPVYNVSGSGPEIDQLRRQMAEDRANFDARTVAAVRRAKTTRNL
ncbi:phage tail length tape measure family protein [Afipia sp. TerB]